VIADLCIGAGIFMTIGYLVPDLPSFSECKYVASVNRIPLFFGIVLYSYEGLPVVLTLRNAMKNPSNFSKRFGVLNVGMIIATMVYLTMGILGYWKYGEGSFDSITLNMGYENM
jgi:solute carrier family 36 (proton-coupled amino acid transporter)